jgi:hypothetical protein
MQTIVVNCAESLVLADIIHLPYRKKNVGKIKVLPSF